jgi:hypothetical protein
MTVRFFYDGLRAEISSTICNSSSARMAGQCHGAAEWGKRGPCELAGGSSFRENIHRILVLRFESSGLCGSACKRKGGRPGKLTIVSQPSNGVTSASVGHAQRGADGQVRAANRRNCKHGCAGKREVGVARPPNSFFRSLQTRRFAAVRSRSPSLRDENHAPMTCCSPAGTRSMQATAA